MRAYIKIENLHHYRIQKLYIDNEPVEADKTYQASYITGQGVPQHLGDNRERLKVTAIDAMKKYLAASGPASEELMDTFTVI